MWALIDVLSPNEDNFSTLTLQMQDAKCRWLHISQIDSKLFEVSHRAILKVSHLLIRD